MALPTSPTFPSRSHDDAKLVMIELGLSRISRLLKDTPILWRAIHVAGTNGKGSVCAHVSAMLTAGKIKCGRFTSPHLIDRWDCIAIDGEAIDENLFREVEAVVKAKDQSENIKASEFELLTATAFEIFNREKIEVGVVEVGLGGRHDATNVISTPAVTVISKIGKDHQSFLGHTLEEITYHKAGIMKPRVPCVVDGSNDPIVLDVLAENAEDSKIPPLVLVDRDSAWDNQMISVFGRCSFEQHQQTNICLAFEVVRQLFAQTHPSIEAGRLLPAIQSNVWPGRLHRLNIELLTGRTRDVLLDGAHNVQSADALGIYVDGKLREKNRPVTWMIAVSQGKNVQELLSCFVRPGDNLVAVEFGLVDGMPWASSQEPKAIVFAGKKLGILNITQDAPKELKNALQVASQIARQDPLVIAGSLYLVSDVLRLLRQRGYNSQWKPPIQ